MTAPSIYLSAARNFPALKSYIKHIKSLHSISPEINGIMIQQKRLWGGRRSLCEECLDTKERRKARSLRWVGFHTCKEPQCAKLRVRRGTVSWCHHRCRWTAKGWRQTKGQVWVGDKMKGLNAEVGWCRKGIWASFCLHVLLLTENISYKQSSLFLMHIAWDFMSSGPLLNKKKWCVNRYDHPLFSCWNMARECLAKFL